jgi:ribonuclease E
MKKEMLINVLQPEECRIAIVEDGTLEELYVERASQESYVGNIYKGRIVNIEPSIQAAFVDFGIGRNGFLHVSDVDPVYYKHLLPKDVLAELEAEEAGELTGGRNGTRERGREQRGERGERRERGRGRPPRLTEPEEAVTVAPHAEIPPANYVEEEDLAGFDEGLELGEAPPEAEAPPPPSHHAEEHTPQPTYIPVVRTDVTVGDEFDEDAFAAGIEAEAPPAPPEAEAEVPAGEAKAKGRGRTRSRKKTEEPAEGEEGKARGKPRRTRKKAEAEPEAAAPEAPAENADGEPDEKPRPMGGAERRTSGDDDEPEIKPFFDAGITEDFDPDAPNDRFVSAEEPTDFAEDEAGFDEEIEDGAVVEVAADEAQAEAVEDAEDEYAPQVGRGFNDTDEEEGEEYAPSRRGGRERGDRDRNDRTRGRGRGRRTGNDRGGRPPARDRGFPRPPIQEIFKRGQEVIVQVIKEGIGTKGPTLCTFISIAGRYLVLMPSLNRVGVSRKIEDHDARKRLREIMTRLNPPKGVGFIVRTAAIDRNEKELQNDLTYLLRLWQVVVRRIKKMPAPVEIYRESDMITRTIRDIFTNDVDTIWVDEANAYSHASEFLQIVMPRFASRIRHYDQTEPLFHKYGIEEEIAKLNQKRIDLPQGGSIIIEQTEALVAIDVNSGTFRAQNDAEETAYRMNMLAAKEIARQLRLRDLGGVIVNDFIDMRREDHRRNVEQALRDALRRDRARTKILRISMFGIIEMTRQRIQPSLKKRIFNDCPHCRGTGYVKTNETMGIEVMRLLQLAAHRTPSVTSIGLNVHVDVAFYLLNRKRREIAALEEQAKMEVQINGQFGVSPDLLEFRCYDSNGNEVRLFGPPPRMFRGGAPRQLPDRRPPVLD